MLSTALSEAFPDMTEELSTLRPVRQVKPEKEEQAEPQTQPVKMEE